ncbi:HAD family hydrolase [Gottschalkiaceae bacterium SANA]|nr:HAD family hydrolase [Gottschalkiaceae bacterium SANA]
MAKIRAVLFDVDGVLIDSMPQYTEIWQQVFSEAGVELPGEVLYRREGATSLETRDFFKSYSMTNHLGDQKIDEIEARKRILVEEKKEWPDLQGAFDTLKAVKETGAKVVVVTGSMKKNLRGNLSMRYPGMIEDTLILTGYDYENSKPHPEPYLRGMKLAACHPDEVIVVENAPFGVESAKAAGCKCFVVNTGILDNKELLEAGADEIFSDHRSLAKALVKEIEKSA